jgi:hypothetical protein
MGDGLDAARALLPGVRLASVAHLGGNERSVVDRVRARQPDGSESSLIVKQYQSSEGWVRESAALSVVPPGAPVPTVVAVGKAPPVLILADLGAGPSVADALLGDDPAVAARAVIEWAEAVATLHAATRDLRPAFRQALAERQGEFPVADAPTAVRLEDTLRSLDRHCGVLGIRVPAHAFDELRGLSKRLTGSGTAALSPADTCPDNNVRLASGLALIDFEDAQWRHVAWDVAYLRVPWPSCWCAWRMPGALAEEAVAAYRRVAVAAFPEVATSEFERQIEAAEVGWAFVTVGMSLDNALGSDPPSDRPMPTRRARILYRLAAASRSAELPAAAELADGLGTELRNRWGDVPLALAPAFKGAQ